MEQRKNFKGLGWKKLPVGCWRPQSCSQGGYWWNVVADNNSFLWILWWL